MNWALVKNWNDKVRPEDTVYHLGDVAFRFQEKFEAIQHILRSLNGKKILILGNHDTHIKRMGSMFDSHMPYIWHDVLQGPVMLNPRVRMNHYPEWDAEFLNSGGWHLHGHEHNDNSNRSYRMLDVGVDAQNYAPISYEEIFHIMKERRNYIPGEEVNEFKREDRDKR